MSKISSATGCRVLGVDYRLAPEFCFPSPVADARSAFDWLGSQGVATSCIALAGDSAGGNLVLALLLALAGEGAPMPACAVLLSPWTDLSASGESYRTRAASDPIHQRPMIQAMARNYLGATGDAKDPMASPLFAPDAAVARFPPLLIQVGERETVLSDATDFADKARRAGVRVQLEVWDDMIHVFQQFPTELSQAREAIAAIGGFVQSNFNETPSTSSNP
jgi:acetyl esterase/lipase